MGNSIYSTSFRLRANDFDFKNRLFISAILDLFQDVAGKHADILNVGYDSLIKKDLIWVVLRTKIDIIAQPSYSEEVLVTTWPHPSGRVDMDRDYLITSLDKNKIYVKGSSKWVICSYTSRKLIRAKDVKYDLDEGYCLDVIYKDGLNKISVERDYPWKQTEIKTSILDVDHNGHINNSKYANYIYVGIKELRNYDIEDIQIEYISELKVDTVVNLEYTQVENIFIVKGIYEERTCFVAKIKVK